MQLFAVALFLILLYLLRNTDVMSKIQKHLRRLREDSTRHLQRNKVVDFTVANAEYDPTVTFLDPPVRRKIKRHEKSPNAWCPCDFCDSSRAVLRRSSLAQSE